MADLPLERIFCRSPSFYECWCRLCWTNRGEEKKKPVYGVIFTCLASRAVHLEVANSLDTDECINALRQFISRRGQDSHLLSENGTNFISASRELREALTALNHDQIQRALKPAGVDWKFNPPGASHFGGTWEHMIRTIRRVHKFVLHQQQLDDDRLHTVLCEVEAILNDPSPSCPRIPMTLNPLRQIIFSS